MWYMYIVFVCLYCKIVTILENRHTEVEKSKWKNICADLTGLLKVCLPAKM